MFKIFDFLSIEFFKQYVSNQYNNDTYQELNKLPIESNQFEDFYSNYKVILKPTWLTNMNYYHGNNVIDRIKLKMLLDWSLIFIVF